MKGTLTILLLTILLSGCIKITFREYFYIYRIETQSSKVSTAYRIGNGKMLVDTIKRKASSTFGKWEMGFGSEDKNHKYYIKVKNDTAYGYIKVTVLRNNEIIKQDIRRDSIILTNL